jgi:hypothetical protein
MTKVIDRIKTTKVAMEYPVIIQEDLGRRWVVKRRVKLVQNWKSRA